MELRDYFNPIRRWWWLILIAALLSAATSYWYEDNKVEMYSTRTTLIVGSTISLLNPTDADFRLARQLAGLYGDIVTREPMREAVMESLGLSSLPRYDVSVPAESQLIEIIVTDSNPQRAQAVANELANQLIQRSPSNLDAEELEQQEFVRDQLVDLEGRIRATEAELLAKQEELAELVSAEQIARAQSDLTALDGKLSSLRSIYATFISTTDNDAVNTISVVETAALPRRPLGTDQDLALSVLLAASLGLTAGVAAAYLLEYLDSTLSSEEDVARVLQLPVIGRVVKLSISRFRRTRPPEEDLLISNPRSPHLEAFRTIKTNLSFAEIDREIKTIMVASPGSEDGKSTVASNLAVAMCRAGLKVLLLDGDLRRPSLHRFFRLPNENGLSNLVLGECGVSEVTQVGVADGLSVITGGTPPPNPTEVLASKRMDALLRAFRQEVDVVIVDSPPFLLADASVLASKVDAVLLVVRLGHTQEEAAQAVREQLRRAGARVVGVVLNYVDRADTFGVGTYLASYVRPGVDQKKANGRSPGLIAPVKRFFVGRGRSASPPDRADGPTVSKKAGSKGKESKPSQRQAPSGQD